MNQSPQNIVIDNACDAIYSIRDVVHSAEFNEIVKLIINHRSYVTGVGKAALAARKLASTLASNGTKSTFMHATELLHGDLGAISQDDIIIAYSNSGKTDQILELSNKALESNIRLVLITGNDQSDIAKNSHVVLSYGKINEACSLNLTPTTSFIVQCIIADSIAMVVQSLRGLTYDEYSRFHGGGYLGYISRLKNSGE